MVVQDIEKLIDLSWCSGVTDVNALGEVHTLDVSHCRGVIGVSALVGKVYTLTY